jgi:DNA-binding response OmpR family regulator
MTEGSVTGPYRVLVVDDDPLVRTIATKLLAAIGCAGSVLAGDEGLVEEVDRAAKTGQPYDLLLVDLQLGHTTGIEVARRLRADGVDVAIVLISGDDTNPYLDEEALLDGTLRKPFSLAELRACVERHGRLQREGR